MRDGLRSGQIMQMGRGVDRIVGYWWQDTLALMVYHANGELVARQIWSRILREPPQTITLASVMDTVLLRGVRRVRVSGFYESGQGVMLSMWSAENPDSLIQWRFAFRGSLRGIQIQRCSGLLAGDGLDLRRFEAEGVVFGGRHWRMLVYGGGEWRMVEVRD